MISMILTKIFGSKNDRVLKRLNPIVEEINERESYFSQMSDDELRSQTAKFKERLEKGETVDDLLPEAFSVVREASKRTLKMRHFDCQLIVRQSLVEASGALQHLGIVVHDDG